MFRVPGRFLDEMQHDPLGNSIESETTIRWQRGARTHCVAH